MPTCSTRGTRYLPNTRWEAVTARSEPRPPGSLDEDGYLDVSSDEMSQTFTVLSRLPLTIRLPSRLKLTVGICSRNRNGAIQVRRPVRRYWRILDERRVYLYQ